MKKALLVSISLFFLSYAVCLNVTHNAVILVDNNVLKIYPKLQVGRVLKNDVLVDRVEKYLPGYEGWLPSALVKVSEDKVQLCKKNNFKVYRSCTGVAYCLIPINQVPIFVYHGNFTKKLNEVLSGEIRGMGNPNSKLWVIELLDPFCPYCALFYTQGGGKYLEELAKSNKIYFIVVMVAFHRNAKGYVQSLELAYVQQGYANSNQTNKFFELEKEIVSNLRDLVEGKLELVNVVDVMKGPMSLTKESQRKLNEVLQELERWNKEQLVKASQVFPAIATPATIFLDKDTGRAVAIMGAQSKEGIINVLKILGLPLPQ